MDIYKSTTEGTWVKLSGNAVSEDTPKLDLSGYTQKTQAERLALLESIKTRHQGVEVSIETAENTKMVNIYNAMKANLVSEGDNYALIAAEFIAKPKGFNAEIHYTLNGERKKFKAQTI